MSPSSNDSSSPWRSSKAKPYNQYWNTEGTAYTCNWWPTSPTHPPTAWQSLLLYPPNHVSRKTTAHADNSGPNSVGKLYHKGTNSKLASRFTKVWYVHTHVWTINEPAEKGGLDGAVTCRMQSFSHYGHVPDSQLSYPHPPSLWQGESGTNGRRQYMYVNTPKKLVSFPGSPYKGSGNEVSITQ